MNIMNLEHIVKIFGDKRILDDVSCGIAEGEKIGIVGVNGTGKSTLLNILAGLEEPDEGRVVTLNGLYLAHLKQNPGTGTGLNVLSYVLENGQAGDWSTESDARTILNKLGLTDHSAAVETLSGGQKKRAALAGMLLHPADVLLLDEPTNHLDQDMIAWLEDYLVRFNGTVIMVTHDRYFLDKVTNRILEIDCGKIYGYNTNYSGFLEKKAQREEMEAASERKRQSILRAEAEWAARGCRARSTKQRARLERLEALKNGKALTGTQSVEMDSVETRMGKKTIELRHVSKRYGDKTVLNDFSYIVLKNHRLGIIGPNGCGKSTLLKLIGGIIEPDQGEVETGVTIQTGYFAQEVPDMDTDQRVIDYVKEVAEFIPTRDGRLSASQLLERFLFDSTMQYTPVSRLSGGEKRRLYLLRVLASAPNVLLLDEPGNDLDIPTLTILEDYLNSFSGIVIAVSHDRYFLDNMAERILSFEGEGRLVQYEGGYTDYLEAAIARSGTGAVATKAAGGLSEDRNNSKGKAGKSGRGDNDSIRGNQGQIKNRSNKLKFTYKEQREYETIDDEIAQLEEKIQEYEKEIEENVSDYARLTELTHNKENAELLLEEKMERWVYLNDLAEQIAASQK